MKYLKTALLLIVLAVSSIGIMTPAMAIEHGKQDRHMMHAKGHGMHHGGGWKSTLTEEQTKQVARLKLDFKKKIFPIKAKIRHTKVELALLITADEPNQTDIDKKIDELVKFNAEKFRLKAVHKIAVRKVLNEEQRVKFDMKILKKAYHGKKGHGKKGCQHSRH